MLAVLTIVIGLGGTTLLGVHTSPTTASADGWTMRLDYPRIARAGLDVTWRVTVTHPGEFDDEDEVELAVSARCFDIFETQGFHPQPAKATSDGALLYLTFDAPPKGDTFAVDYGAYIQPARQLGRRAEVRLLDGRRPRITPRYRTWLIP